MELYQKSNSDIIVNKIRVKGNVYVKNDVIFITDKKLKEYNKIYKDVNGEINIDDDLFIEGNVLFNDITLFTKNVKVRTIDSKFDNILKSSNIHIKCDNFVILDNMNVGDNVIFLDNKFVNRLRRKKLNILKNKL